MSKDHYWRAISIDSITPEIFPPVSLYIKSNGNHVLYKNHERPFTVQDRERLARTFTQFLYVRSGDMEEINTFIEKNLSDTLSRNDLSDAAKGKILYQSSVNCIIDMYEDPEASVNQERCRSMVQHILQLIASTPHALKSLQSIVGHNFRIFAHAVQVTALSLLIHEKLFDLSADEMEDVGMGSLIHDYGMTFISRDVLDNDEAMAKVEYYKAKQHTQRGYEFLKSSGLYSDIVLNIVRYHHERYDGNGFPTGIKGDDIPRSGQVAALCDFFSNFMLDQTPQRKPSSQDALKIMAEETRKGAFNPDLFAHFAGIINESPPTPS